MKKFIILILLLIGQNLYSQSLTLTHPKGGEKFLIGSDTLITWEGVPETEPIRIEFSNDNGLTWQLLINSATGLKYNWTNISSLPSDECIIRIKHIKTPDIEWVKSFGGSLVDIPNSIQQTTDGGYIVAGFTKSLDGDVSENNGKYDYWILKLYPDEPQVIQSDSSDLFSIENPSDVERLPISSNTSGINEITPNPADNKINISVTIAESGHTDIAIYNIEGEKVSKIYAGEVATFGTYEFTSDISNLSNGTYYVIFQTPTVKDSKSIMIVR